jgi:hypothetical protein
LIVRGIITNPVLRAFVPSKLWPCEVNAPFTSSGL